MYNNVIKKNIFVFCFILQNTQLANHQAGYLKNKLVYS